MRYWLLPVLLHFHNLVFISFIAEGVKPENDSLAIDEKDGNTRAIHMPFFDKFKELQVYTWPVTGNKINFVVEQS